MQTPFPGMDPYLEEHTLWPDVHNALITALRDFLAPRLRPRYYVAVDERMYLTETPEPRFLGRADLAVATASKAPAAQPARARETSAGVELDVLVPERIRETFLEVRSAQDGAVVTVIESLSPTNKLPGEGRSLYEAKRMHVLGSTANFVEIDLLRGGARMRMKGVAPAYDYSILVSGFDPRPRARLLVFGLRERIPTFRVPLRAGDEEPEVDLGTLLHDLYDRAAYDLRIDYRGEANPAVGEADRAWADGVLRAAGLR